MKKNFFYLAALSLALTFTTTSCSDDDDLPNDEPENVDPANIEYTSQNAKSWHNYSKVVARLLKGDSQKLYDEWTNHYAEEFKTHAAATGFQSYLGCVEQILDGCSDIAAEVGGAKLGDPYKLYQSGDKTAALYAVESWYSWHSKEDYSNNIVSIQNAYYGQRNQTTGIDKVEYHQNSMAALVAAIDPDFHKQVDEAIKNAYKAIMNIPTPFRNHIGSAETKAAMDACEVLDGFIKTGPKNLKGFMRDNYTKSDDALKVIVEQYVDEVVLPTYTDLKNKNNSLCDVIDKLAANPTNEGFKAACDSWIVAREPWEESEAFLFGPVADFGLDPNMDSWPLDQAAIVNILNSGEFDNLDWDGDYSEENEEIANKQSVRGYHTLEFLLFKDGQARKVNK